VAWERTEAVEQALDQMLAESDLAVRAAVLRRMQREKIPVRLASLTNWLKGDREADRVTGILTSLGEHPGDLIRSSLLDVIRDRRHAVVNRLRALELWKKGWSDSTDKELLQLGRTLEDDEVLAELVGLIANRFRAAGSASPVAAADAAKGSDARAGEFATAVTALLLEKLNSTAAVVRARAVESLAERGDAAAAGPVAARLTDRDFRVQRGAALAVGKLRVQSAGDVLLSLAQQHEDAGVRTACLDALRRLADGRALPIARTALDDSRTLAAAIELMGELGGPEDAGRLVAQAKRYPSLEVVPRVVQVLDRWRGESSADEARARSLTRAIAELQGASGMLARWQVIGPLKRELAASQIDQWLASDDAQKPEWAATQALVAHGEGSEGRIKLPSMGDANEESVWIAYSDIELSVSGGVQFLGSAGGSWRMWIGRRPAFSRAEKGAYRVDSDRFDATIDAGLHRVLVEVVASSKDAGFHLRFRPKASSAERERLVQAALTRNGNVDRGRALFLNGEKSQCIKCHRIAEQGERVGPELTGVGSRFSRVHIVESLVEPGRSVAPQYESVVVELRNGMVISGLRWAETETDVTLVDQQGQPRVVVKSEIEQWQAQPTSIMPEGLEKRFSVDEFIDLVAFLIHQKE
jgi:putative heme-binding domain-containing protein